MDKPKFLSGHKRGYVLTTIIVILLIAIWVTVWMTNNSYHWLSPVSEKLSDINPFGDSSSKVTAAAVEYSQFNDSLPIRTSEGIGFSMSLNQIPSFKNEVTIDSLELKSMDLNTKITLNTEKLELNDLKNIDLKISGFSGDLSVNDKGISINGKATKIKINDVVLSEKIKISFSDLDYQYLTAQGIKLKQLETPDGKGELKVMGNKLDYTINGDKISLSAFNGNLMADKSAETLLQIEGFAKEININGELDFKLK